MRLFVDPDNHRGQSCGASVSRPRSRKLFSLHVVSGTFTLPPGLTTADRRPETIMVTFHPPRTLMITRQPRILDCAIYANTHKPGGPVEISDAQNNITGRVTRRRYSLPHVPVGPSVSPVQAPRMRDSHNRDSSAITIPVTCDSYRSSSI